MIDILIIGAGPAGMSAAIYARRALQRVVVLEKLTYGGQIINTLEIDNYPATPHISGFDFSTKLYEQAKELGAEIIFEEATDVTSKESFFEVKTDNNIYQTRSIIIATGADNKKLEIENEDAFIGKGISYCATCDGAFYKGKDVVVVGGGNTAVEDALYLSNIVNKVYLVHRRDEFRAEGSLVEKLKTKDNVEFIYNSTVSKLIGNSILETVVLTNNEGAEKELQVNGLFIAIGRKPNSEWLRDLVETDEDGYIKADELCHTNIDGIFVAGDGREKELRQLVTATSDGAIAATEAIKYLQRKDN